MRDPLVHNGKSINGPGVGLRMFTPFGTVMLKVSPQTMTAPDSLLLDDYRAKLVNQGWGTKLIGDHTATFRKFQFAVDLHNPATSLVLVRSDLVARDTWPGLGATSGAKLASLYGALFTSGAWTAIQQNTEATTADWIARANALGFPAISCEESDQKDPLYKSAFIPGFCSIVVDRSPALSPLNPHVRLLAPISAFPMGKQFPVIYVPYSSNPVVHAVNGQRSTGGSFTSTISETILRIGPNQSSLSAIHPFFRKIYDKLSSSAGIVWDSVPDQAWISHVGKSLYPIVGDGRFLMLPLYASGISPLIESLYFKGLTTGLALTGEADDTDYYQAAGDVTVRMRSTDIAVSARALAAQTTDANEKTSLEQMATSMDGLGGKSFVVTMNSQGQLVSSSQWKATTFYESGEDADLNWGSEYIVPPDPDDATKKGTTFKAAMTRMDSFREKRQTTFVSLIYPYAPDGEDTQLLPYIKSISIVVNAVGEVVFSANWNKNVYYSAAADTVTVVSPETAGMAIQNGKPYTLSAATYVGDPQLLITNILGASLSALSVPPPSKDWMVMDDGAFCDAYAGLEFSKYTTDQLGRMMMTHKGVDRSQMEKFTVGILASSVARAPDAPV